VAYIFDKFSELMLSNLPFQSIRQYGMQVNRSTITR